MLSKVIDLTLEEITMVKSDGKKKPMETVTSF